MANFSKERVEGVSVWFSYTTIVAFYTENGDLICSENVWSSTTGRHLNKICPKNERISHENFKVLLDNALTKKKLSYTA